MGSGQVVPAHVYDEIDTLLAKEDWWAALEIISKALSAYQDKKLNKYNCLWLYRKGAYAAAQVEQEDYVISFLSAFIKYAEPLASCGPHELQVHLRHAKIRPPRSDEIEEARAQLGEFENEYRRRETEEKNRPSLEVNEEIKQIKKKFLMKGSGCIVSALYALISLIILIVLVGVI